MKRYLGIIALTLFISGSAAARLPAAEAKDPVQQDSLSDLIDVLAEKGILSTEEQEGLKQRIEAAEKAAPPPAPEKPEYPTVKTKVRVETRFSSVQEDEGQPYFGSRDDRTGGDGFAVRRARLYVMGDLNPNTGYKVQYQSDWGHDKVNLHIGQMEWRGWEFADLIMGQIQSPVGYELPVSDAYLLCTDRSAVSNFLPADKDIGLRLDSKRPILGRLDYQLYLGNGSGKHTTNTDGGYLWASRVTAKPRPDLSVGASYSHNRGTDYSPYQSRFLNKNADPYGLLAAYAAGSVDETCWEIDAQWRSRDSCLWAEYIRSKIAPDGTASITTDGYYVYLHHLLPYRGQRDKLEALLGYQQFDANRDVTDQYDLTAYTLGLNYHITGSRYGKPRCQEMIRLNYIWSREAEGEVDNDKLVIQYQLWF